MKKLLTAAAVCMAVSLIGTAGAFAAEPTAEETTAVAAEAAATEETKTVAAVSANGLINIELPDSDWQEVITDEANVVYSNGNSAIAFNVYKKDTALPERHLADENHDYAYEITVSRNDYVFIASGIIFDEEEYDAVVAAVKSIEVNEDKITDEILAHQTVSEDEYSIKEVSYDVWVNTDVLNLRAGGSTDFDIITGVAQGTKMQATGIVLRNGLETGWTRVNYNGTTAYAATQFLSQTEVQPAPQPEPEPETEGDSYIGYTYGGTDPWGNQISITLRSESNGELEWTYTQTVDENHFIYRELNTPFSNGYGEFYIEGTIGDNYDMNYNYAGNIKLQGGGIELTFTSGEVVTLSEEGDSAAHQVEALPEGSNTVELYRD